MLLPWYASLLISAAVAITLWLVFYDLLLALLAYCAAPVASLCLFLFRQPLLMPNWMAAAMIILAIGIFVGYRMGGGGVVAVFGIGEKNKEEK